MARVSVRRIPVASTDPAERVAPIDRAGPAQVSFLRIGQVKAAIGADGVDPEVPPLIVEVRSEEAAPDTPARSAIAELAAWVAAAVAASAAAVGVAAGGD